MRSSTSFDAWTMISPICCICGSKRRTSNSMMVLAVLFIWSMASSNEVTRSWMSVRSNGVMKLVRKPRQHLTRHTIGLVLEGQDFVAAELELIAAREHGAKRPCAGDNHGRMPLEQRIELRLNSAPICETISACHAPLWLASGACPKLPGKSLARSSRLCAGGGRDLQRIADLGACLLEQCAAAIVACPCA